MDVKKAFKTGFILKLAEERVDVGQFYDMADKAAAARAAPTAAAAGPTALGLGTGVAGLAALGLAGGMSVPRMAGTAAGQALGSMANVEVDTLNQAKKKYLIKKLRRLIREIKAQQRNRFITQVKQEIPE